MKNFKALLLVAMRIGLLLPHIAICMENNQLTPYSQYRAPSASVVLIKQNKLAIMGYDWVEVYNLNNTSTANKGLSQKHISHEPYNSMDLTEDGTKIGVSRTSRDYSNARIYSLEPTTDIYLSQKDLLHKSEQKNIFGYAIVQYGGIIRFLKNDGFIIADRHSIKMWNKTECELKEINNKTLFSTYETSNIPIITTLATSENQYAYYSDRLQSLFINTNDNPEINSFIVFVLTACSLPYDIIKEIVLKIPSTQSLQQIKLDTISDTICSIEYSANGKHIALTGKNSISICTMNSTNSRDKDRTITIPFSGFSAFHPNNKTIFVWPCNGTELLAIDLKTKKVIYKMNVNNRPINEPAHGKQNKLISFNEEGDKLAAIVNEYCVVYDVPKNLQNFFNTYDPETVAAEYLPEKPIAIKAITSEEKGHSSRKSKKENKCVLQ